jgi:hypothetical protein
MSENKRPTPLIAEPGKKICPVCGKPSYSPAGVHPQCAVRQADAARQEQRKAGNQSTVKRPQRGSWQKKCPKCGAEIHVRKKMCDCGYGFGS